MELEKLMQEIKEMPEKLHEKQLNLAEMERELSTSKDKLLVSKSKKILEVALKKDEITGRAEYPNAETREAAVVLELTMNTQHQKLVESKCDFEDKKRRAEIDLALLKNTLQCSFVIADILLGMERKKEKN